MMVWMVVVVLIITTHRFQHMLIFTNLWNKQNLNGKVMDFNFKFNVEKKLQETICSLL